MGLNATVIWQAAVSVVVELDFINKILLIFIVAILYTILNIIQSAQHYDYYWTALDCNT